MKIGIFDSGLGGLVVTKAIIKKLPEYDLIYLGDTKRVPYGDRSQTEIFKFTCQSLNFLFKQDCKLVIIACNTASAKALRKIQRQYLPKKYPDKKVLGVIIPTVETAVDLKKINRVGILATTSTVNSKTYLREFKKLNSKIKILQQTAPQLAPLIESGDDKKISSVLKTYLRPLVRFNPQAIILGCTHYSIIKNKIQKIIGTKIRLIDQDKIIAHKLKFYLKRHPDIAKQISKNADRDYLATSLSQNFKQVSRRLFGKDLNFKLVKIN